MRKHKTRCPQGHSYDAENTYRGINGYPQCRTCGRERGRAQPRRKRCVSCGGQCSAKAKLCRKCYRKKHGYTRNRGNWYRTVRRGGKRLYVHRLVMEKKLGRPLHQSEHVHHLNEDRFDNRPKNLAIMSAALHTRIHLASGDYFGEKHGMAKLTETQVRKIRASSKRERVLAQRFGVSRATINMVRTNKIWKQVKK
jgi:hypothetical protein